MRRDEGVEALSVNGEPQGSVGCFAVCEREADRPANCARSLLNPLIAACADHHIAVVKRQQDGRTISYARPLSNTERVAELARMLGGTARTPEVREHAEQLLRQVAANRGAGAQI